MGKNLEGQQPLLAPSQQVVGQWLVTKVRLRCKSQSSHSSLQISLGKTSESESYHFYYRYDGEIRLPDSAGEALRVEW